MSGLDIFFFDPYHPNFLGGEPESVKKNIKVVEIGEIWNFVTLSNELFTFSRLILNGIGASRNRSWFLLQNRSLQYRLLQRRLPLLLQVSW